MENVNIVLGRFQPFTKGHEKILVQMYEENKLPTVMLLISNTKFDSKHPFSDDVIKKELELAFNNKPYYKDALYVKSADILKFAELLHENGYQPKLWGTGTDRLPIYKKMADKYKERAGFDDDFDTFEIKRTDDDISATKVRTALKENDIVTFKQMMPDGTEKMFNEFKEIINGIDESLISLNDFVENKQYDID